MAAKTPEQITDDLLRPLSGVSARYLTALAFLAGVIVAAFCAFGWQIYAGIGVAGIRRPVFWGFYITNFVFWIGLSHAGTLISAILRLANATWRRPVTRCAEVITVFALSIGATFPIIHLGKPWLAFPHCGRMASSMPAAKTDQTVGQIQRTVMQLRNKIGAAIL